MLLKSLHAAGQPIVTPVLAELDVRQPAAHTPSSDGVIATTASGTVTTYGQTRKRND